MIFQYKTAPSHPLQSRVNNNDSYLEKHEFLLWNKKHGQASSAFASINRRSR